jgi:hypothetical protein
MKRSWAILISGVVLAVAGYFCFYFVCTANYQSLQHSPEPELAWLKSEFHLSDADFKQVARMHEAYLAGCAERCRLIDEKSEQLKRLLAMTNTVTPEVEKLLSESAQLRAECQKKMLQQFYEISQTMPPEQGKRYLTWMQEQTVLADSHSQMHH